MDPLIDPIFVYPEEQTPIYDRTVRETGILPGAAKLAIIAFTLTVGIRGG